MSKKKRSTRGAVALSVRASGLDRLAWYALVVALALVPFVTSNFTLLRGLSPAFASSLTGDQSELPKFVALFLAAAVGLGAWLIAAWRDGRDVRWGKVAWLAAGYLGWVTVCTFTAADPSSSLFGVEVRRSGLLTIVAAIALGFVAMQMSTTPERMRTIAMPLVISGAAMSLYGLLQILGLDPLDWGAVGFESRRAFGMLGNPDLFASFLIAPVALAPMLALTEKDERRRTMWWAATALVLLGWLLSFVRSAWIGGAVGLVITAFGAWRARVPLQRSDRIALGFVGVLLLAAIATSGVSGQPMSFAERISSLVRVEGSVDERLYIWDSAVEGVKARPVTGWGPAGFTYAWFTQRNPDSNQYGLAAISSDAHNVVLGTAAETGVVGLAVLLGLIGLALVSAWRPAFGGGGAGSLAIAAWWAALLAVFVTLLANVQSVTLMIAFWVAVGVLAAASARSVAPRTLVMRAVALTAGAIMLAGSVAAWLTLSAEVHYARAGGESVPAEQAAAELNRAIELAPWEHSYKTALATRYAEGAREFVRQVGGISALDDQTRQQYLEGGAAATTLFEAAIADVPLDYATWAPYLEFVALSGRVQGPEALAAVIPKIDEAIALFPSSLPPHVLKARTLYELGRYDEALTVIEPVRDWDPTSSVAGVRYVMTLAQLGRIPEATAAVNDLAERFPNDSQVRALAAELEQLGVSP